MHDNLLVSVLVGPVMDTFQSTTPAVGDAERRASPEPKNLYGAARRKPRKLRIMEVTLPAGITGDEGGLSKVRAADLSTSIKPVKEVEGGTTRMGCGTPVDSKRIL